MRPTIGEGHDAADERAMGERVDGWATTLLWGWVDKHEGIGIYFFVSKRWARSCGAASEQELRMDARVGSLSN